ncbi:MAG: MoaD/ThiS family protein [Oscillospiraceae bacterium]|nr:MoaD/ThiS family protein [Oscillospiraceae bacterium]
MITVKLYGLLRLDSGIKERRLEAAAMKDVIQDLTAQGISPKDINGCVILVNGKPANKRSKLQDGDVVQLLSPVAGG